MDLWNNLLLIDGGLMLVGIPFLFILRGRKTKQTPAKGLEQKHAGFLNVMAVH